MQNSSNTPTPNVHAIWVTSRCGRYRFDASPIFEILCADEVALKDGSLGRQYKQAADALSIAMAENNESVEDLRDIGYPVLKLFFAIRDVAQSLKASH